MDSMIRLDLSSFSKELRLLLTFMRIENRSQSPETLSSFVVEDIDWTLFLRLARHHRVFPILYSVSQSVNKHMIPVEIVEALGQDYVNNTFHMFRITAELERINQIFLDHNIPMLTLKGPALAHELYGGLSLRTSKDLDILIPVEDVNRAEEILFQSGYMLTTNKPRILNDWKVKLHHLCYYCPEKKVQVELHWRLNSEMGKEPRFQELWSRKNEVSFGGAPVYYPCKEDLFFYLVVHGSRHAWFRLRWLADIDRIIRNGLNGEMAQTFFKRYHCEHLMGQAMLLSSELLGDGHVKQTLAHPNRSQQLAQDAVYFIKDIGRQRPTSKLKRYLFSIKSQHQKWSFILGILYPSSWDAKTLPLPKWLHFLYIPLRPFLWYWRKRKQQQLSS